MRWTLSELAEATGGRLVSGTRARTGLAGSSPGDVPQRARGRGGSTGRPAGRGGPEEMEVDGVAIDTRTLVPGQLWVALRGQRDGHDFAPAAVEAGAGALLVERPTGAGPSEIIVADTAAALLDIGRAARGRLSQAAVLAVTGSVGKTSTKDLLAAAVTGARRSVASPASFNNELGLPLTLANASADAEVAVLEMGARGPGHIALLCRVSRPDVGIVTAVAPAHLEMFGDLDGVARAKGELVEALPATGTAVLNGDDPRVRAMAQRTSAQVLIYRVVGAAGGAAGGSGARDGSGAAAPHGAAAAIAAAGRGDAPHGSAAELVAESVTLDDDLRPTFIARTPWGQVEVVLEARGIHQVGNALAALGAAGAIGVPLAEAASALRFALSSPNRMDVRRTSAGGTVINDAYNANPASMAAALRSLAALDARRRVAVLGAMAELGPAGPVEHRRIGELARQLGIEVMAVETDAYGVEPVAGDVVELLGVPSEGTAVLVKASRVAALERVATRLLGNGS